MKKLIVFKFIFLLTISFFSQKADKDYKLLIISKISGSFNPLGTDTELEILKTSIQEDRKSPNYLEKVSMVKYFRPPGNIKYAAMGDQKLQITGFYPGTDKTIINCVGKNLVNYPVKSTITIYWLKNIIQVTEEDFQYGGLDYSALYNFKKILVQGENIKNTGKYECLECNIPAFCPTSGFNFEDNQVVFNINNQASKLQKWEFKEVEYTNTDAFGTLIGEGGLKLGQFSLNEEQFNFTLEAFENALIKCKIKKNQEKLNKQKKVIESIELLLKDDQLNKAIKVYKDNSELLNFDFVNNRFKKNRAVKEIIGSYASKTPYDGTISIELTNVAYLLKMYQKNNKINVGKYDVISDLNSGVILKNETTKINLSNKPLYVQKEGFSRPWVGKINSTLSKEVVLIGASLPKILESNIEHPTYGKLNFFYVKNKKNEELILSGYSSVGYPSEKKYHNIKKLENLEFNSSLSGKNAQLILNETYKIDNQKINTIKTLNDKSIKIKTFI